MKKLRLEMDELKVESFSTLAGEQERATVEGYAESESVPVACVCVSKDEALYSCAPTCNPNDYSCNGGWSCAGNCTASCPRQC